MEMASIDAAKKMVANAACVAMGGVSQTD